MQALKYPKGPVIPAFQEFKSLSSFEIKLWDKRLFVNNILDLGIEICSFQYFFW